MAMTTSADTDVPPIPARMLTTLGILLGIAVVSVNVSVAVSSIAMGSGIILFAWLIAASRGKAFRPTPLDLFFLCYLLAEVLATIFSANPPASLFNMKRFFQISIFYLTLVSIDTEAKMRKLIVTLIVIAASVALIETFSLTKVGETFARVSMFQHVLTEGGIKMLSLLLVLPFLVHPGTPRPWRIWAAVCATPLFLVLILTQTRSAWLGFIAGAVVIAVVKNKKLLLALVVVALLFFLFAPTGFRERAASIVDPSMTSNLTRIHMITTGWRMFLDHPLFGLGDIDLKVYYVTYIVPIDPAEGGHLHNNIMTLLVTLGGVGLLATIALFVRIFIEELRSVRETSRNWFFGSISLGAFASYVAFHVNGLFEWNFGDHEIAVLLWFTVGLALASRALYRSAGESAAP